jgi:hypothetical protein
MNYGIPDNSDILVLKLNNPLGVIHHLVKREAGFSSFYMNQELKKKSQCSSSYNSQCSEGKFKITYCPGKLTKNEIESVNLKFA